MADARRILQPRRFSITWEQINSVPLSELPALTPNG
jgi:hypothetical protein